MHRTYRLIGLCRRLLLAAVLAYVPPVAFAQSADSQPAASPEAMLEEGRRLLEDVRDFVLSFDEPAFYHYCRIVTNDLDAATFEIDEDDSAAPWKLMLERPGDYRGRLLLVEGVLQACHAYELVNRPGLGTLHQCELSGLDTRSICTLVVTEAPSDIPIRSRIRAKGFFIKARAYRTQTGDTGAGPLLVARRIELVSPPPALWESARGERGTSWWVVTITAALAVAWLLLRRNVRRHIPGSVFPGKPCQGRRSSHDAESESESDFDWLTSSPPPTLDPEPEDSLREPRSRSVPRP